MNPDEARQNANDLTREASDRAREASEKARQKTSEFTREASEMAREASDKARQAADKTIEEVKIAGNQLVDKVRDLIEEGNVRRIKVMRDGKTLLEIPLTIAAGAGAAVVLLNPVIAALGALAALLTDVTLVIERDVKAAQEQQTDKATGSNQERLQDTPASKPVTDYPGSDAAGGKTIG